MGNRVCCYLQVRGLEKVPGIQGRLKCRVTLSRRLDSLR